MIDQIREDSSGNDEKEKGKAERRLHHRDESSIMGQGTHLPSRRDDHHEGSRVGKQVASPEIPEVWFFEKSESRP